MAPLRPDNPDPPHTSAPDAKPRLGTMSYDPGYRLSMVLDPDGTVREVIEADGITGWRDEAILGKHVGAAAAGGVRGAARAAAWNQRLRHAATHHAPARYSDLRPDAPVGGEEVVVTLVTPVFTSQGALESIVVHALDRSSEIATERELRASEQRFRGLAESQPQMVWVADADRRLEYVSQRWETFTGLSVDELVRGGLRPLIHPDDHVLLDQAAKQATVGPQRSTATTQFRIRGAAGRYRWVEVHAEPITGADGEVIQWIGTTIDITRRLEDEAAHIRAQKREALGMLAGGIAHDFNNVISAILSNAQLAEIELAAGQSPTTSLNEIQRGSLRAADLVKRMLSFSKEEEPAREPVDLGAVTLEACALIEPTLPAGVRLEVSLGSVLAPVLGDSTQLHQVVMNLVANAGQAIERLQRPGTVRVELTAGDQAGDAGPPPSLVGPQVRLTVSDDGDGIPAALLERIFDPFFTTRGSGEGTGLGLAAAQTIVRNHGGTLDVSSDEGSGATFVLSFPTSDEARATPAAADSVEPRVQRRTSGARVLFVDDEVPLARTIERVLPRRGVAVVSHTDPRDALAQLADAPNAFDVLITDLAMPEMTGLELIEQARAISPELIVVLSSGYLTPADRAAAEQLGVDAIVEKPCSVDDLLAAIAAAPTADA